MNNVIAEYDERIEDLVEERDSLLAVMEAVSVAVSECRTLDIGAMSRSLDAIARVVNDYRRRP